MNEKPSCRIYLFRHGETANSKEVCFNGHFDIGLSAKGENQFREWAKVLKGEPFKAIYSSDLERTIASARLLGETHDLELAATYPELRELRFGDWEGLSITEEAFGEVARILQETLEDGGVEDEDVATIMGVVAGTAHDIISKAA